MRGIGAGLYYGSVSGSQGVHQRRESQHKGIIPGTHDQCNAVWRWFLVAPGMKLGQWRPPSFFSGKAADMFQHIADLFQDQAGFAHITFKSAFAQIFFKGIQDFFFILRNSSIKAAQAGYPHVHRKSGSGLKIFSLSHNDIINFFFRHFDISFSNPYYYHYFPLYPSAGSRKAPALQHS